MSRTVCAALLLLASLAGRAGAGPTAVEEIRGYLDRAMYRTGRARLEALLAKEPDSAEGRAMLAELSLVERDWAAAEAAARRAVELAPESSRYLMLWSRARFELGREDTVKKKPEEEVAARFTEVEAGFRRVLELEPENPDALWWIGWTREWRGDYASAVQLYDSQIAEFPANPGGYLRLGQIQAVRADRTDDGKSPAARKLRDEALAIFDRGLEKAGEDAELLYYRALALQANAAAEQAVESFERSIFADPDFERSWSGLRKLVDADEDLVPLSLRVLEKHPTAALAAWRAGYFTVRRAPYRREKPWTPFEKALGYMLPALDVHGDHEEIYKLAFRAAQALIGENPKRAPNAAAAVDAFERIHRAYAWSGDAANNLGFYFRETRKYKMSLAWYLKAVERAPESQDVLNDTGLMYLFHVPGERAKGLPFFLKAVALVQEGEQGPERGYWDALENLCKHYWEIDRQPEKVVEYARMRYEATKGIKPYNMSEVAADFAKKARKLLSK